MDPQHMGHHPVSLSQPLPSRGGCGICLGLAAQGGPWAAPGPQARVGMLGMDILLCHGPSGRRRFPPWALLCGSLAAFVMSLGTLILPPDVSTSFAGLLGSAWCAIFYQCMASLTEQMARTVRTIGHATHVMSLSRQLVPWLHNLCT